MENKRGISHIEVILSFVIFIGFLIFLFAIFKPFEIFQGNDVYLDIAEREIKDNVSVNVDFFTLKLNSSAEGCFYFTYSLDLSNISVKKLKDENYEKVEARSKLIGSRNEKREITINGMGDFFYVYSSREFNEDYNGEDCRELEKEDYTIGLFRSYDMVSFRKIEILKEDYNLNYETVRKNLGLAKDFSFSVRDSSGNNMLNVTKKIPKTGVYARDAPIQLVYTNGSFEYAILNTQTW